MKKLVSFGLALVMCCCLPLSACAVQAENVSNASNDLENIVDTFAGPEKKSADIDVESFANPVDGVAGSRKITEAYGTITLSNPILYTISASDLKEIDMTSMDFSIEGLPYDDSVSEYLDTYYWPGIDTIYAIPNGTKVTLPTGIVTSSLFEIDVTFKDGACYAEEFSVLNYPGFDSITMLEPTTAYFVSFSLEDPTDSHEVVTTTPGGSGVSGSAIDNSESRKITFYVPTDSSAANPFGFSAPTPESPETPATPAGSGNISFTDVAPDSPFKDAITWAVENGITNGKTSTTFGPNDICTISHILTFLWRANGRPGAREGEAERDSVFRWANEQGMEVLSGALPSPCTRARAVNFMWMAAGKPQEKESTAFTDVYPDDFTKGIAWAVEKGITTGTSATTFSPDRICTRGQIVTFLYRAYGK